MSGGVVYRAKRRGVIYAGLASPLLAAAWLTAHRLGWRGPRPMALVMGVGSLIYCAAFFGFFGRHEFAVFWTAAGGAIGFVSGLVTGAFISIRAYERVQASGAGAPEGAV